MFRLAFRTFILCVDPHNVAVMFSDRKLALLVRPNRQVPSRPPVSRTFQRHQNTDCGFPVSKVNNPLQCSACCHSRYPKVKTTQVLTLGNNDDLRPLKLGGHTGPMDSYA